jgi:hypothetical protein
VPARTRYHDDVLQWNLFSIWIRMSFKSPTVRMTQSPFVDPSWSAIQFTSTHHHTEHRQRIGTNGAHSAATIVQLQKKTIAILIDRSPPANLAVGRAPLRFIPVSTMTILSRPSVHRFHIQNSEKKGHCTKEGALGSPFGDQCKGYAPNEVR